MAKIQETLQVWGNNHSHALSIQGEAGSRVVEVTFLDASGAPIDLTGCTPRMVVNNGAPKSPMNDGVIVDAAGGVADFTITSDMLTIPGEWPCEFVLSGPNYPPLKVHGLTLPVEASNTEKAVGSQNQLASLWIALNKADTAAQQTEQAEKNSETAVTNANQAIATVTANESTRQTNEQTRQSNESTRQSDEDARKTAEAARANAESTRETDETTRQTNENTRKSDETARASAESTREDNENTRKTNETARQTAESTRESNEDTRKKDESSRQTAETARATAESARVSAESARVTDEKSRADAESSRVTAESARVTAENKRQTDTQTAISGANTARDSANTAADRANTAAENAEDAIAGKLDPAIDSRISVQKNQPNGIAGLDGAGKVAAAQLPSMDYVPISRTVNGKALSADVTLSNADVGAAPVSHTSETVSAESGVHGIRWYNNKLQAKKSDGTWEDISAGSNGGYATADVTGLSASAGNGQATIAWTDPPDGVVNGIMLAKWAGSKLVRKEGSYPTDVTDGTLLVDNTVRDQYKTTGYVDSGLTNGTTYYYAVFPYTDTGAVNKDEANRASATPQAYVKYGVRWHKGESPALERLYDSASFTFQAKSASAAYHSDFDGKPIYKDIKICNVQNGAVTAYEGEAGFSRTGSNGDVMAEIPKFWYKVEDSSDYRDYIISDDPLDGFAVAPRHAVCDDYPNGLDKIYVGAYEATSGFKSVSGYTPLASQTRAQFRTGFTGRGTGYVQADWATQFEIGILMIVETANLDTQSTIGFGYAATTNSSAVNTGGTDTLGAVTGTAGNNNSVIWRGLENLWGNVHEWRDGINFNAADSYACVNPSKYKDDTGTDYTKLAYSKSASDGFISSLGYDPNAPWAQIPTASSGSASTYFCDQYYQSTGWRVANVGGGWGNGSSAGFFYLNSSRDSTPSSAGIGSRLLVLPR